MAQKVTEEMVAQAAKFTMKVVSQLGLDSNDCAGYRTQLFTDILNHMVYGPQQEATDGQEDK